eukprot:TRINITY_DN5023_c0_g1_i1.p1 TRINITY_DN5023_c0_g1~~TRINITY_DN5023_c0_g1_i1.p1  ORF type:complete len:111 (+),score=19.41 TRINITY_DN5023_c0_g1_i1:380-712(+)
MAYVGAGLGGMDQSVSTIIGLFLKPNKTMEKDMRIDATARENGGFNSNWEIKWKWNITNNISFSTKHQVETTPTPDVLLFKKEECDKLVKGVLCLPSGISMGRSGSASFS